MQYCFQKGLWSIRYGLKAIKITARKETKSCCESTARDEVRRRGGLRPGW